MNTVLYNGDCLEILKMAESNSVDLIFTSPPFKEKDLGMTEDEYWLWYAKVFDELWRVTKNVICIVHSPTKMNHIIQHYPPKRTIIWGKQTMRFYAACWRYNPIFVYQKNPDYNINKYIWSDTFAIAPIKEQNKANPYEDPLLLYTTIIKMFKGCESVLDPFMGSGTSKIAAESLGKSYVGIEIKKEVFDYAVTNTKENDGIN